MDDPRARIDQEHGGADAVDAVGEAVGFGCFEIDYLADEHRAAQVWNDKPHALAHLLVNPTIPRVPENTVHGGARRSLVERNIQDVHQALRPPHS